MAGKFGTSKQAAAAKEIKIPMKLQARQTI